MSGKDEWSNTENIAFSFSEVILPDVEPIYPQAKYSRFESMSDCPNKYVKLTKW